MSTLTPNYNLNIPEDTDSMDSFFDGYEENMNIIDENLGGGGGGSDTIVGMFVDTSRIILASTAFTSSYSYIATEDCFAVFYLVPKLNDTTRVLIDGVSVSDWWRGQTIPDACTFYVKKGQTISVSNADSTYTSYITVYGVTQGTKNIFTPIIYSDNERCIGVWRDNKPLYQRVWDFGSDLVIPNNSFYTTSIDASNIETIVEGFGIYSTGATRYDLMANTNGMNIRLQADRTNGSANIRYFVMTYTKISDVAGSGDWNTDGAPMHHYSTTEHVIGTWIDGSTLYEKTIEFPITSTLGSGFNTIEAMPNVIPIDMKGHLLNLNDGRVYPLNYSNSTATSSLFYYQGNITLNIQNDSWGTGYKLWVTVQYIKTA